MKEYTTPHDWAILEEGFHFNKWEYSEAGEGEKGGVVVFLAHDGNIRIYEGLVKTKATPSTTKALKANEKVFYSIPLRRHIGMHKSLAVQAAILRNPRKAKELVIANKLAGFKVHECLRYFEQEDVIPPALAVINQQAAILLSNLNISENEETPNWERFGYYFQYKVEKAYGSIQSLTDEQLESILLFLESCEFGQYLIDRLDTNEHSLFNKIAADLAVDMRDYWRPDEGFLNRRNKVQLQALMNESGASAKLANASEYKKGELVKSLTKFFQIAKKTEKPTETDLKANDWLPEAMNFPAIDPDRKERAVTEPQEDFMDEDEILDEEDNLGEDYAEAA